ncbi:MAG: AI-2E family transporter [Bacteroidales bacterium]|nr:AI-2E family transporter [Bacteroidales bacterium]
MISQNNSILKTLHFVAVIIIILAGILAAHEVIELILLALFFTIITLHPVLLLEKKKVPYTLAIVIVLSSISLLLLVFAAIIGDSISKFMSDIPLYGERLTEIITRLIASLNDLGMNINENQLLDLIDSKKILNFTTIAVSKLGEILSDYFLIILIMVFMLLEFKNFSLKIDLIEKKFGKSMNHLNEIANNIRHYLSIKTYVSILTGVLIWLSLTIIGVNYAILWGLIAFLLNYIPNIGSLLAAVPTILFALLQLGMGGFIWASVSYLLINMIVGNIVEPKIMGKGLGLSTLVVFVSLIVWGFLLGTVGVFLSVPITIAIKILLEQNKKTRWIAVLLGSTKETKVIEQMYHQ